MQLANKVALITGASSGLGKDFAQTLLDEGMVVYVLARREAAMAELVARGAHPLVVDITEEAAVQAAVAEVIRAHGGVDVLVNNAGFGLYGAVEQVSLADARYQFEVNLFGLAHLTQLLIPAMRARGGGKIVNISSMGGKIYSPLGAWYHATKHALEGWSDCLRLELAASGIEVVVIEPGAIQTEFGQVMLEPLLQRSRNSPYQALAEALERATQQNYTQGGASAPALISRLLLRALRAPRARTRYVGGKYARSLLFLRRCLSDRGFDRLLLNLVK